MLQNNNLKGTLKLGIKAYKKNKVRNLIIIFSMIITTILITVSLKSIYTIKFLTASVNSPQGESEHGYNILDIIKNVEENSYHERIEAIGNFNGVDEKTRNNVYLGSEYNLYLKPMGYEELNKKYIGKNIIGRLPQECDEIILPTWLVEEKLGYEGPWSNIYIDTIKVLVDTQDKTHTDKRGFKVVGYYEEEKPSYGEFIEIYAPIEVQGDMVNTLVLIFIAFTLISGFFLITNIFHTSVVQETRFYGMLKTIGVTKKGMKILIFYQASMNLFVALPIGILVGTVFGEVLIPQILELTTFKGSGVLSNDLGIYIFSLIFIGYTVYLSCKKPIEYIEKISPVEAAKFIGSEKNITDSTMKLIKEKNILKRIAMYNLFSNERKTLLTIGSICISGITIIISIGYYQSYNTEDFIKTKINNDFTINSKNNISPTTEFIKLNQGILQEIQELSYIENINTSYGACSENYPENSSSYGAVIKNSTVFQSEFITDYEKSIFGIGELGERKIRVDILDENEIPKEISKEKFDSGEGIILFGGGKIQRGEKITLEFKVNNKWESHSFEVLSNVSNENKINKGFVQGIQISQRGYEKIFKENPYLTSIKVDVNSKSNLERAHDDILAIVDKYSEKGEVVFNSKEELINEVTGKRQGVLVVGIMLSLFIGMIGFISIMNSMLSSIITRSAEFALFESIGMTKKQQKKLLVTEGLYYTFYTAIVLVPTSFVVSIYSPIITIGNVDYNLGGYLFSLGLTLIVISLIMGLIPLIAFKYLKSKSVVDRIRESKVI